MGSPTVVKNVQVIRREVGRFVQGFGGLLRLILSKPHDPEPHPSGRVLGIGSSLFLNRG